MSYKLNPTPYLKAEYPAFWKKLEEYLALPLPPMDKFAYVLAMGDEPDEAAIFRKRVLAFNKLAPFFHCDGLNCQLSIHAETFPGSTVTKPAIALQLSQSGSSSYESSPYEPQHARLSRILIEGAAENLRLLVDKLMGLDALEQLADVTARQLTLTLHTCTTCGTYCGQCVKTWSEMVDNRREQSYQFLFHDQVTAKLLSQPAPADKIEGDDSRWQLHDKQYKPQKAVEQSMVKKVVKRPSALPALERIPEPTPSAAAGTGEAAGPDAPVLYGSEADAYATQ